MTRAHLAFVVVGTLFMGLWGAAIVLAVQVVANSPAQDHPRRAVTSEDCQ